MGVGTSIPISRNINIPTVRHAQGSPATGPCPHQSGDQPIDPGKNSLKIKRDCVVTMADPHRPAIDVITTGFRIG